MMDSIYISAIQRSLGKKVPIESIPGISEMQADRYLSYGYKYCRISNDGIYDLCKQSVDQLENLELDVKKIDSLIYAIDPHVNPSNNWMLNESKWKEKDIRWLIQALDISPKSVLGLSFYNCASFISAIDVATLQIKSNTAETVLVVIGGSENQNSPRFPHSFHVQSDGAVAFLVSKKPLSCGGFRHISHNIKFINPSKFRSIEGHINDTLYFSIKAASIRDSIMDLYDRSGISAKDIDLLFVQNLGTDSMNKYADLCSVERSKVWKDGLPEFAHVIGSDSLVNLSFCYDLQQIKADNKICLLGTSGMSWGGCILEFAG